MQIDKENRFNFAPQVKAPRSTFLMHKNIRTTFNAGLLIPIYANSDIMPGDTFKIHGTIVCRETTSIHPTMDNAFLDVFGVFVPHRLSWEHWKEFWGENDKGAWVQTTQYQVPQIRISSNSNSAKIVQKGDALQYMGIPIGIPSSNDGILISALPWRAYAITWNELFRDENVCPPLNIYKGDTTKSLSVSNATWDWGAYDTNARIPPGCAPVYKYKDYFNACLPEPQKGNPITLPIGSSAPVKAESNKAIMLKPTTDTTTLPTGEVEIFNDPTIGLYPNSTTSGYGFGTQTGLYADLQNAIAATINAQRFAFAAQKILEAMARGGSRYWEILEYIFGVYNPNAARLQRPELLFHRRIPINMTQVPQTSSTDSTSAQGNVAAYSLTVDTNHLCTKSFVEHGTLLFLVAVRQEHSYDSGIARMWSRKDKLDFYHPQMAFLGEQAILNKEIYATGTATDDQVFGYNERWAELRYEPNINTGAFSTKYAQTLASWHYGDAYNSLPVYSDQWRRETPDFIDRTLVVAHTLEDQFLLDSRWEFVATRCLPMYSIPSLIDHF